MSSGPNFLILMTDQQRFDTISALGNPHLRTLNLDRLVKEGVVFNRSYCQHPICQPSRASFMTGRYPSTIHVTHNGAHFPPAAEATLWSRLLAEAGYHCGLAGKFHLSACHGRREPRLNDGFRYFQWSHTTSDSPVEWGDYGDWLRGKGYDPAELLHRRQPRLDRHSAPTATLDNVPSKLRHETWCTEKGIEFIKEADSPWLLCVNTFDPHPPFDPPWEYFRRFKVEEMPMSHFSEGDIEHQRRLSALGVPFQTEACDPSIFEVQVIKACYYAMVEHLDNCLGRLIQCLEETGQRERTVVLFTSDHGEMLGDHGLLRKGCRFYEGAVRVPHIWSAPSLFPGGVVSEALVELMDVGPTVLELAGRPVPSLMQGRSFRSILTGEASPDEHRPFVRSEYFLPSSKGAHGIMHRDDRWKLITYHVAGLDDLQGELFDLQNDPWELDNLWWRRSCQVEKERLLRRSYHSTILATDLGPVTGMRH